MTVKIHPRGPKYLSNFNDIKWNDSVQCKRCGHYTHCPQCNSFICERCGSDMAITEREKKDDSRHSKNSLQGLRSDFKNMLRV